MTFSGCAVKVDRRSGGPQERLTSFIRVGDSGGVPSIRWRAGTAAGRPLIGTVAVGAAGIVFQFELKDVCRQFLSESVTVWPDSGCDRSGAVLQFMVTASLTKSAHTYLGDEDLTRWNVSRRPRREACRRPLRRGRNG